LETILSGGAYLNNPNPLRLNVGFLLNKDVGFSRNFDFEHPAARLGDDFFVLNLRGGLRFTRTSEGIFVSGRLKAASPSECVRCLDEFEQPLSIKVEDLFIYPPEQAGEDDLVVPETGLLDLQPLLREYFLLALPIQGVCRPDCRGLCGVCGNNLNDETCDHPVSDIDPRMAILKTLLE
jgi:uncharacterized protein